MTKDDPTIPRGSIKSIAIIGGGASGTVMLDTLIKQNAFDEITVFEKRDKVGGIWVVDEYKQKLNIKPGSKAIDLDPSIEPPSGLSPGTELTVTSVEEDESYANSNYQFTPSYQGMRTKTTESVMTFSDAKKWPKLDKPGFDSFTKGTYVQQYLEEYGNRHKEHIQLCSSVEKIIPNGDKYLLYIKRKNKDGTVSWYVKEFDTFIIATGAYHVPYIPDVPGLTQIYEKFPDRLSHSKSFTNNEEDLLKYKDKVVIIVGGRPSASDLARFIERHAKIVYCSIRSPERTFLWETTKIKLKPLITNYSVHDNEFDVNFNDGSVVGNPDYLIYCTGYQNSYPFLKNRALTTGWIVPNIYQHIFSIKEPKVTFLGLPLDGLNFRCIEYQAILISRYLSGLVTLPSKEDQMKWCQERYAQFGDSRLYHTIGMRSAISFSKELTKLGGGVENGIGKRFPVLTEEDVEKNEKDKLVFKQDYYLFEY